MDKKINILLVDDSELITSRLNMMIDCIDNMCVVDIAPSVQRAKEITAQKQVDVVILDIQLSDGDGIVFLKWIKELYPKTIVIMFTTFSEVFFRSFSKKLGADYFLDKSTEFDQIPLILSRMSLVPIAKA